MGVAGGMGQAICPGDRPALMALPLPMLLTLPLLTDALAAARARGSGGCCRCGTGPRRTTPGDSRLAGETDDTGDGVNAVLGTDEWPEKTDTRLLSRIAAAAAAGAARRSCA